MIAALALFALPVLVGLGLRWSAHAEIAQLQTNAQVLEVENRSYRAATGELTAQLQSLQTALTHLGEGSVLIPTSSAPSSACRPSSSRARRAVRRRR